ncbi:hypothetical protein N8D74_06720 [Curtobacterium flaccumfaciens]|uniref:Uncharacterized protein n=1 Tax=Curtobacterium poinsettiae TaxID=159612 RepID=A0A9Q9T484_9MICO|nr:hypothetical protein [Curtobacterium flaccumfaciens]UXN26568.1 hypothetical protein N8D74_06720 [Curtobacterium flaccumfaciens]UYC81411.1 hypothetical protein OE229_02810 [Curtobacterium flaccumfaciens pv. poinsettiae]
MPWWTRESNSIDAIEEPSPGELIASQVVRESRLYGRAVQSLVLRATLVTVGLLLYLWLAAALFGTQNPTENEPMFEVHPLSGATIVGVYAGLGGVIVALQFGARSVIAAEGSDLRTTARSVVQRNFLRALATGALFAAVLLGCLATIWYARLPHLDVTRVVGALLTSTFLAFIAAETHVLLQYPVAGAVRELLQHRRQQLLRHVVRTGFPPPSRRRTVWTQRFAAFVVAPVMCTALSDVFLPAHDTIQLVGRFSIIVLVTATAWLMVLLFMQALFDRQPGLLIGLVLFGILLAGELLIVVLQAQLQLHGAATTTTTTDLARGLLGMWVCVAALPFAVMGLAARRSDRRGGFIINDVRLVLQRRLDRLERAPGQQHRARLGRLVLWSWVAVPFFPFGVLLGRRAAREAAAFGHRGVMGAKAAAWTCGLIAAVSIAALIALAYIPQGAP